MARYLSAAALALAGSVIAYAGLVRLGWRRHGRPPWDLGFLHLDWIPRTDLPYWSAHMMNLALLVCGLVLVGLAFVLPWRRSKIRE